jgi:hypothetical protein
VRDGLVDVSHVTASYTRRAICRRCWPSCPRRRHCRSIRCVLAHPLKYLQAANEYKGVKLLGVDARSRPDVTVKKPVTSVADLAGMKIRAAAASPKPRPRLGARRWSSPRPSRTRSSPRASPMAPFFRIGLSFNLDKNVHYATFFPAGSTRRRSASS